MKYPPNSRSAIARRIAFAAFLLGLCVGVFLGYFLALFIIK